MNAKSKILMVVDGHYPSAGGAEMQVRLLSKAYTEQGYDVQIWAPRRNRKLPPLDQVDQIPVRRISYPHIKGLGAVILYMRFAYLLLSNRNEFLAIHVNAATYFSAVAGLLRPVIKATIIAKIAGADEIVGGILDQRIQHLARIRALNWAIKRLDYIQSLNKHVRDLLLQTGYLPDQIASVPNAVDLSKLQPQAHKQMDRHPLNVGFVGRLVPVKGLPSLLRAWKTVAEKTNATLTIAGDGPQRQELEALATELQIDSHVKFLGETSDVAGVLATCDLYVQPSLQEGMPNSVLEAMACGLAVVATNNAGNREVVEDGKTGLLVPIGDEEQLASAVTRLLSSPETRRAFGNQGRNSVESKFGIASVTRSLLQRYQQPRSLHTQANPT